ncbi:hypothetical protein Are01nite_79540 [Actinoplanes regularis]|nr:hypothetical protein Are01nite_79540 [Actinoplanes regularis]
MFGDGPAVLGWQWREPLGHAVPDPATRLWTDEARPTVSTLQAAATAEASVVQQPLRLDGGCLPSTDKATPLPQLRTDLLLEYHLGGVTAVAATGAFAPGAVGSTGTGA